jgi:hypothetical protein
MMERRTGVLLALAILASLSPDKRSGRIES